jgi:DNA primase
MKTSQVHRPWINFKELRARLRFEDVLRLYKVEPSLKGVQHQGPCPLPMHDKAKRGPTFSANCERGIFRCFACGAQGNLLDFAALMEGVDPRDGMALRKVAVKLQEHLVPAGASRKTKGAESVGVQRARVNAPLDFDLKGLDAAHPFFERHGIPAATASHFGAGFCSRGLLAGRIAIPLHDAEGRLVGYAGRIEDDTRESRNEPRYLLPARREREGVVLEFDPTALLYNLHRIPEEVGVLTVSDDIMNVWTAHAAGREPSVALIGDRCAAQQIMLISSVLAPAGTLQFVSGNEKLAREFLPLAAQHFSTRWLRVSDAKALVREST